MQKGILVALGLSFFSTSYAHSVGGAGLTSGLTHPIFGLDHLLAMVAVGILGSQMKKDAAWKLPALFVGFMLIGGIMGINNLSIPMLELGIAFSVLILGLMVFTKKTPLVLSTLAIGFFAVFHGNAHGMEMPQIAQPALYILGFITATSLLHISGILLGHYAQKTNLTTSALKYSGVAMSLIGGYFLLSS